jgi:hypothetical protein
MIQDAQCRIKAFTRIMYPASCILYGGERTRTADFLLAKQALSQLSYTPDSKNSKPQAPNPKVYPLELGAWNLEFIMVGLGGVEPPTSPLSGVRSNLLSYRPQEP